MLEDFTELNHSHSFTSIPYALMLIDAYFNAVQVSKSTFMRGNAPVVSAQRKLAARVSRSQVMTSKAYLREYPDPEFIEEVKEKFPEQPIANIEEARVS